MKQFRALVIAAAAVASTQSMAQDANPGQTFDFQQEFRSEASTPLSPEHPNCVAAQVSKSAMDEATAAVRGMGAQAFGAAADALGEEATVEAMRRFANAIIKMRESAIEYGRNQALCDASARPEVSTAVD